MQRQASAYSACSRIASLLGYGRTSDRKVTRTGSSDIGRASDHFNITTEATKSCRPAGLTDAGRLA
eukprot:15316386-Alexandrium_andersonii.AAC.1